MCRVPTLPYEVPVKVADMTYTFKNYQGVMMAWVKNEHVGAVLEVKVHCCGNATTHPFRLANEAQIDHWERYKS